LYGIKETGGKVEVLLLQKISVNTWEVLLGGKRIHVNTCVRFGRGLTGCVIKKKTDGTARVKFSIGGKKFIKMLSSVGHTPIPPYIKTPARASQYQTIYADPRKPGSAAAPTAGLHFTKRLFTALRRKGIQVEFVTLHVGLGTFAPVKTRDIKQHKIHPEFIEVEAKTRERLYQAKKEGRRIIAVGTTTVRTLESVFVARRPRKFLNIRAWVHPFFYPGYHFRAVDGMLTNFHLPKSTLFMLVSAFAGRKRMLAAYRHAIRSKYRFYSFGDAMLLL
jgi:S-adenosylmethionine:tRNA ribosyltransferase-isomerase